MHTKWKNNALYIFNAKIVLYLIQIGLFVDLYKYKNKPIFIGNIMKLSEALHTLKKAGFVVENERKISDDELAELIMAGYSTIWAY